VRVYCRKRENHPLIKEINAGIRRERDKATPMQAIRIPDIRLIILNVSKLMQDRTDPSDPQRNTHQAVDPKKIPATKPNEEYIDVPGNTIPKPGKIATKKISVSGFAMAMATMDK
jgi:hypothetical protein